MEIAGDINKDMFKDDAILKLLNKQAKRYICGKCGEVCGDIYSLSKHRNKRHPRFTCGNCDKTYMQFKRFQDHLKAKPKCLRHLNEAPLIDLTPEMDPTIPTQNSGIVQTKFLNLLNLFSEKLSLLETDRF